MPKEPQPEASSVKRRVYELPIDLVERVTSFQKEQGLPSEVEAVRRLLDEALMNRDTIESILYRYFVALEELRSSVEATRRVLVGHPLIETISFQGQYVTFSYRDPDEGTSALITPYSADEVLWLPPGGIEGQETRCGFQAWRPEGERLMANYSGNGSLALEDPDRITF